MRPAAGAFIAKHSADVTLRDGGRIRIRPIVPDDKAELAAGLDALSPESRHRRFFSAMNTLTPMMQEYLTEVDYHDHFAWVALDLDDMRQPGVGVARYIRLSSDPTAAEVAVAVADEHHRRGIGTLLVEVLAITAREHCIERLVASVLVDNEPMKAVFRDLGATLDYDPSTGVVRAKVPVPAAAADIPDSALYRLLRTAARGEGGAATDAPTPGIDGGPSNEH